MKNGFTLIELLGVIALLAIIAAITFPNIQNTISTSKQKTLEEQKNTIITASKRWTADNNTKLTKSTCYLSITKLQTEGYLASNKEIKDPTNNKKMTGCVKISWDSTYKQYLYSYTNTCTPSC